MPYTAPVDTLAHHMSRPLTSNRDMSSVPVKDVVQALQEFMSDEKIAVKTYPESEALTFYGLNHGMALIAQNFASLEPLSPEALHFVELYHATLNEKAVRAFYYLLLICTREARHCKSWGSDKGKCSAKFGSVMSEFLTTGSGEQGIHNNLMNSPPETTIGNYTKCIQWAFYNCKWPGGYGGKAWGQVTDCMVNFVTGAFTAEMMLDTIWTLCHNNGPIFNKGHLYQYHNTALLVRILDIQRSGQIPQSFILGAGTDNFSGYLDHIAMPVHIALKWVRETFGLSEYVDWFLVEALGSVQKYPSLKHKQVKTYGPSVYATDLDKIAEQQATAEAQKEKQSAEAFAKNYLEIYPGFVVPKLRHKRVA